MDTESGKIETEKQAEMAAAEEEKAEFEAMKPRFIGKLEKLTQAGKLDINIRKRCDIDLMALLVFRYLRSTRRASKLLAERKQRGLQTKAALKKAIRGLSELVSAYEALGKWEKAAQERAEVKALEAEVERAPAAFATRRLGVQGEYQSLLLLQEYIRHRVGALPKPIEFQRLVEVGYEAKGLKVPDDYRLDKSLKHFRKANRSFVERAQRRIGELESLMKAEMLADIMRVHKSKETK